MNIVIVRGTLSRPVEEAVLPSGDRLLRYQVTVARPEGPAESVPVTWTSPPRRTRLLDAGTEVVVRGRVRRRFFRAGGVTASRTEVAADAVVPASQAARARACVQVALDDLAAAEPVPDGAGGVP